MRNGLLRSCGAIRTLGWKWQGVPAVAAQAALSLVHDPAHRVVLDRSWLRPQGVLGRRQVASE